MESFSSEELQPKRSHHDSFQNASGKHAANPQPYAIPTLTAATPLTSTWYVHPPLQLPNVQIPAYCTTSAPPLSASANLQPPPSTKTTGYQHQIKSFYPSARLEPQSEPVLPSLNPIHKKGKKKEKKKEYRGIFQRRIKRNRKIKSREKQTQLLQKLQPTICRCLRNFGFQANPEKRIQENFNKAINNKPSPLYEQPTNLAFHNLCSTNELPLGTRELLGLNLTFCLASKQLQNNINHTIKGILYQNQKLLATE
jgi:hypothetical protein